MVVEFAIYPHVRTRRHGCTNGAVPIALHDFNQFFFFVLDNFNIPEFTSKIFNQGYDLRANIPESEFWFFLPSAPVTVGPRPINVHTLVIIK